VKDKNQIIPQQLYWSDPNLFTKNFIAIKEQAVLNLNSPLLAARDEFKFLIKILFLRKSETGIRRIWATFRNTL
jgi:hypothetical protein